MIAHEKIEALEQAAQPITPRWLRIPTAVQYCGICRSLLYTAMGKGDVKSRKIGNVRVICRLSLDAYIESQDDAGINFVTTTK